MTSDELCTILNDIVQNKKTLYVNGGIGYRLTLDGKQRAFKNKNNLTLARRTAISNADSHTWAFDCNNLILAVVLGWKGDENKSYGGADWSNPKWYTTEQLVQISTEISTNFNVIEKGELVWIKGHVGIYIGNGRVIECTPKWLNCVQYSNLGNVPQYKKGNYRVWSKHCKLPFINYNQTSEPDINKPVVKTNEEIANEVIRGLWGNGLERKKRLTNAGYDYKVIQSIVNAKMKK